MKLLDKVAIVTGASAGIGKTIAELFAAEGAKVIALARRKERLEELSKEAAAKNQVIHALEADVTNDADIARMFDFAMKKYRRVDILINNAGMMDNMTPLHELTDELWDRVMNVNVGSLMKISRKAVNIMLAQNGGVIVNIASLGGFCGSRAGAAYTASKHAVIGLTKNIGFQYADKGIRCNAICPGGVKTEIGSTMTNVSQFGYAKASAGMQLNPRLGEAAEIAAAALFLASDDSSFVNGTTLVADAGWSAY